MKKILVIDDEPPIRILLKKVLEREGFQVLVASNGKEGTNIQKEDPADLIITDLIMPDKEGIELIREFKENYPQTPIVAMSGGGIASAKGYLKTAKIMGADDIIEKPVQKEVLLEKVKTTISDYN